MTAASRKKARRQSKPGRAWRSADAGASPQLIFDTLNAYQRTFALKAAIELDVFTLIGAGDDTVAALASKCRAAQRGVRILCDFLVIIGFLTKHGARYRLTADSAMFLDRRSPACLGTIARFIARPEVFDEYADLTAIVRRGGTADEGAVVPENPLWVEFARSMAPLMYMPAEQIASILGARQSSPPWKALDIAAGHGLFGITLAKQNPRARVVALDWPQVLEVAKENARAAGVSERYDTIAGSAFEADFGGGYDVVLLTNFLHHFDPPTNEKLLRKVRAALQPGGRAVTLEFVPNPDRVTPPAAASFAMMMLGHTHSGDAYTFAELEGMFRNAGFKSSRIYPLAPHPESVIVTQR